MENDESNFDHERPRASLRDAVPLLAEMIRQLIEEDGELSFFNAVVEGNSHLLGVTHDEDGNLSCFADSEKLVSPENNLAATTLERLRQRGWWHPKEGSEKRTLPSKQWGGVTTRPDRRHVAKEMIGILTDIYEVPVDHKIYVQLRLHGKHSSRHSKPEDRT